MFVYGGNLCIFTCSPDIVYGICTHNISLQQAHKVVEVAPNGASPDLNFFLPRSNAVDTAPGRIKHLKGGPERSKYMKTWP